MQILSMNEKELSDACHALCACLLESNLIPSLCKKVKYKNRNERISQHKSQMGVITLEMRTFYDGPPTNGAMGASAAAHNW